MAAWIDINIILGGGWPPSEMDKMPLSELAHWYALALEKSHDMTM